EAERTEQRKVGLHALDVPVVIEREEQRTNDRLEKLQRRRPIDRLAELGAEGIGADGDRIEVGGNEEIVGPGTQRQRARIVKIVKHSIFENASSVVPRQRVERAALPVRSRRIEILESCIEEQISGKVDQ